jgi:tetratricopeptide (TPR) repeat protein
LGDNERALADANQMVELEPNDVEGYVVRGNIYNATENYSLAVPDFTFAIEHTYHLPLSQARYYVERGRSYLNLREYEAALADLLQAIDYKPNDLYERPLDTPTVTTAYWLRGWTYYELENYDASLADFTEGITRRPNDPRCYEGRGYTYYQMKTYDLALVDLRRYVELAGDNARLETLHLIETIEGLSI